MHSATEDLVEVEDLGDRQLVGFTRPASVLSLVALRQDTTADALPTP